MNSSFTRNNLLKPIKLAKLANTRNPGVGEIPLMGEGQKTIENYKKNTKCI